MVDDVLASTEHSLSDVHRIGIGFGGVLDTNRGVILKSYQIAGWDNFPLQKWAEEQWGKPVVIQNDARIVYAAAGQDDEIAKQILNETCQILGIAISNVIAILHPERVIVGGGVSLMGPLFWNTLRSEVTARAMPLFISSVQIFKADLGKMSW